MRRIRRDLSPRKRRQIRVRAKVYGSPERPRLNVFRSANHIYAQVIDDDKGYTLVAASTVEPGVKSQLTDEDTKMAQAKKVGQLVAQRAKEKGINAVVFDRAGYLYHGRIKALADGAREAGLEF
ncbi:MAG TPA: 50S ribosomal protein L18 [Chloroflexia bacterium]|nr:50S ribosomal protein L18 [Chloroflexia bacterium]